VDAAGRVSLEARVLRDGRERGLRGDGNGPIDAFVDALGRELGRELSVADFHEHALGSGADAVAVAYVELEIAGAKHFGAGRDANIVSASLRAILSALDRSGALHEVEYAAVTV
jgi:2-isopropylmalate synthase